MIDLIVPYRLEDRPERYKGIIYKKIQDYIKNGSKGDLNLYDTPIDSLPNNLTSVLEPPSNLKVFSILDIYNTKISDIPKNLYINGDLFINYTPIRSKI